MDIVKCKLILIDLIAQAIQNMFVEVQFKIMFLPYT